MVWDSSSSSWLPPAALRLICDPRTPRHVADGVEFGTVFARDLALALLPDDCEELVTFKEHASASSSSSPLEILCDWDALSTGPQALAAGQRRLQGLLDFTADVMLGAEVRHSRRRLICNLLNRHLTFLLVLAARLRFADAFDWTDVLFGELRDFASGRCYSMPNVVRADAAAWLPTPPQDQQARRRRRDLLHFVERLLQLGAPREAYVAVMGVLQDPAAPLNLRLLLLPPFGELLSSLESKRAQHLVTANAFLLAELVLRERSHVGAEAKRPCSSEAPAPAAGWRAAVLWGLCRYIGALGPDDCARPQIDDQHGVGPNSVGCLLSKMFVLLMLALDDNPQAAKPPCGPNCVCNCWHEYLTLTFERLGCYVLRSYAYVQAFQLADEMARVNVMMVASDNGGELEITPAASAMVVAALLVPELSARFELPCTKEGLPSVLPRVWARSVYCSMAASAAFTLLRASVIGQFGPPRLLAGLHCALACGHDEIEWPARIGRTRIYGFQLMNWLLSAPDALPAMGPDFFATPHGFFVRPRAVIAAAMEAVQADGQGGVGQRRGLWTASRNWLMRYPPEVALSEAAGLAPVWTDTGGPPAQTTTLNLANGPLAEAAVQMFREVLQELLEQPEAEGGCGNCGNFERAAATLLAKISNAVLEDTPPLADERVAPIAATLSLWVAVLQRPLLAPVAAAVRSDPEILPALREAVERVALCVDLERRVDHGEEEVNNSALIIADLAARLKRLL